MFKKTFLLCSNHAEMVDGTSIRKRSRSTHELSSASGLINDIAEEPAEESKLVESKEITPNDDLKKKELDITNRQLHNSQSGRIETLTISSENNLISNKGKRSDQMNNIFGTEFHSLTVVAFPIVPTSNSTCNANSSIARQVIGDDDGVRSNMYTNYANPCHADNCSNSNTSNRMPQIIPVSYTHLTLPTILRV